MNPIGKVIFLLIKAGKPQLCLSIMRIFPTPSRRKRTSLWGSGFSAWCTRVSSEKETLSLCKFNEIGREQHEPYPAFGCIFQFCFDFVEFIPRDAARVILVWLVLFCLLLHFVLKTLFFAFFFFSHEPLWSYFLLTR